MRIVFFSSHGFEREAFIKANTKYRHDIVFLEPRLTVQTAGLAAGCDAVCAFVSDRLDGATLDQLEWAGVRLVLLRSAGFNHVDLDAAERLGLPVMRVPAYSPNAIAEHAFALLLALVRRIPRAHNRVREGNFSLDGLVGFDLSGKTFGVVGTGRIGSVVARIARGFGCRVLAHDIHPDERLTTEEGVMYVALEELLEESHIVSLHLPLSKQSHHLISLGAFEKMRQGALLVNTSRGGLVDSSALVDVLKAGKLGGAALDVYEGEDEVFFRDHSGEIIQDDVLMRLLSFPNVIVTAHQGFLTCEALRNIADITLANASVFEQRRELTNQVQREMAVPPRP